MNMYTALTHTFMYDEALVRCLPVPSTRADSYTFNFQRKDSEIIPGQGAVISFPNLIIALHLPEILYGIDSLSVAFSLFTVHVYLSVYQTVCRRHSCWKLPESSARTPSAAR